MDKKLFSLLACTDIFFIRGRFQFRGPTEKSAPIIFFLPLYFRETIVLAPHQRFFSSGAEAYPIFNSIKGIITGGICPLDLFTRGICLFYRHGSTFLWVIRIKKL
jgi:hypothetical protein